MASASLRVPGYNFEFDDAIDYASALPPHIAAQQPKPLSDAEQQHRSAGMFLVYPLPERHPSFGDRERAMRRETRQDAAAAAAAASGRRLDGHRSLTGSNRSDPMPRSRRQLLQQRDEELAGHWLGTSRASREGGPAPAPPPERSRRPPRVAVTATLQELPPTERRTRSTDGHPVARAATPIATAIANQRAAAYDALVAAQLAAEAEELSELRRDAGGVIPSGAPVTTPGGVSRHDAQQEPRDPPLPPPTPLPAPLPPASPSRTATPTPERTSPPPPPQRQPPQRGRHRSNGNILAHDAPSVTALGRRQATRRGPTTTITGSTGSGSALLGRGGASPQWELDIDRATYDDLLSLGDMAVCKGLPKEQLQAFRPVKYSGCGCGARKNGNSSRARHDAGGAGGAGNDDTCAVCLEQMKIGCDVLQIFCGHTFHFRCLIEWLTRENTCPLCRFELARKRSMM